MRMLPALLISGMLSTAAVTAEQKQPGQADADGPDNLTRWKYRRTIVLHPPTSLPDLAVPVILNTDTMGDPYRHVNSNGSDLCLVAPDGKTALAHWIESWDPRGQSKVWVRIPATGTGQIHLLYDNPAVRSASASGRVFDFFDDFNDGLWTKYPKNPVLTRTQPWETRAICEPSVIYEDGLFRMWYMGSRTSTGYNAALGLATSPDGLAWTKNPGNPILREPNEAVIRTTVIRHRGTYYLFASDHQWTRETGVINRWTSQDGLRWTGKTTILRPTEPWEKHFHNIGVVIDEAGLWHMLYTTDRPFGYAYSKDGLHWTKHKEPVIQGFYGGDPYLTKIGPTFYAWHSREHKGHLRIYCASSPDMIHWRQVGDHPQIGYSQPWERGIGRPEVWWDRHLADAELLGHRGKVLMYYGGAQCPFGVATFDGTFARLAERLKQPPLRQWAPSHYPSVDDGSLRIADNETEAEPIRPRTFSFSGQARHALEFRLRCDAGYRLERVKIVEEGGDSGFRCYEDAARCVHVIVRWIDSDNFARLRAESGGKVYYEERIAGTWSKPIDVGTSDACDGRWHGWRIFLDGRNNRLSIDGKETGAAQSSPAFAESARLRFGFSVRNTFVSIDDVRMRKCGDSETAAKIAPEEKRSPDRCPV